MHHDGPSQGCAEWYGEPHLQPRLSRTRGGVTTTYGYDRADRITGVDSTTYTVNANGNLTARGGDSFGYDQANRLVSATVGGASSQSTYDGDGKRVSQTSGGVTTSYAYDANKGLPRLLEDETREYVWGLDLAYAVDSAGSIAVYHTDGLGSVRALTDGSGQVTQTYQTDEFGMPAQTTGSSDQPFQFAGEQRDGETGFYYLRTRMYDPPIGRFFQRDTLLGSLENPLSLHRYIYAENNPVNRVDPCGQKAQVVVSGSGVGPDACDYYDEQCQRDPRDGYACEAGPCCREFGESTEANQVRECLISWDQQICSALPLEIPTALPPSPLRYPRNNCRWAAHLDCYFRYGFRPSPTSVPLSCYLLIIRHLPVVLP